MRGQDPMTDKVLQKDLAKMGFSGEVVKQYRKIAKIEDEKKGVDVSDNIDPKTGLPPGFNPEDYK
jgi:two-component SAPR family response regulator